MGSAIADTTFTFSGEPSDANRAADSIRRNLEALSRQALQTSAALKMVGGNRDAGLQKLTRDADDSNAALGRLQGGIRNVNVNFSAMRNMMSLLKFPALISAVGLATQALLALAAAGTAVVSALTPLVGLLGTMPAALGTLASSMVVVNLAFKDFSQALSGNEEALKRLTPQARDFLRVIKDLRPFVRDLRQEAQQGLFTGLTTGLERALTPQLRRTLERGVGGIAGALGGVGAQFGGFLGRPETVRAIGQAMSQFAQIIQRSRPALIDFTQTFLTITNAAAPLTRHVENLIRQFASWSSEASKAGAASGRLQDFFRTSGKTLDVTISLLKNFGTALFNIGKAAAPLGRTILKDLNDQAARLAEITGSPEGQRSLAAYFERAKPGIYEIGRLVRDLAKALIEIGDQPAFGGLIRQIRTELLPVLTEMIIKTTEGFGPALVTTLTSIGKVFGQLGGASGPLTVFVRTIGLLAEGLNKLLETVPGLNQMVITLVGLNSVLKTTTALAGAAGLSRLAPLLGGAAVAGGARGATRGGGGFAPIVAPTVSPFRPPPVRPTFGQRLTGGIAGAAPLIGAGAVVGGTALGGTGGAALTGAGLGLALAAPIAPLAGPFAPAVLAGGAIGGGLIGLAASALSGKKSVDQLTASMSRLTAATARNTAGIQNWRDAQAAARNAVLNVQTAELALEGAHKTRIQIMRDGIAAARAQAEAQGKTFTQEDLKRIRDHIKASYDYRVALQNEKNAEEDLRNAKREKRASDREELAALKRSLTATHQYHQSVRQLNQSFRDKLQATDRANAATRRGETATEAAKRRQEAHNQVVRDYIDKMRALADQQRNHNQPELAKTSDRAADLAAKMNEIPTHKEIFVDLQVSANLSFAGARAEHIDLMNQRANGDGVVGVLNSFVGSSIREYMNRYGDGLASAAVSSFAFTGGSGPESISPGLYDDLALARADGLTLTSGFRPGAHTIFGNASLHSTFPARAIDVSGSAGAMNAFFNQEVGRPGIVELIHNPYAWYPGAGIVNIAGTQLGNDHIDHVHVGIGDGIVGARKPRTGDGLWSDLLKAQHSIHQIEQGGVSSKERDRLQTLRQRVADIIGKIQSRESHRDAILASRFERLELRQQLAGTYDTMEGAQARARFIRRNIIPTERRELHELERLEKQARRSHNADLAKQIAEQIHDKQNQILQSQLDAQNAIKDATEETANRMGAFGGTFGFEFGGGLFTDRLLGSGVGA